MTPDIKRILVPLDFSANSRRALDYAHGLALKFDAALHLVHVCEVPSMIDRPRWTLTRSPTATGASGSAKRPSAS